MNKLYNKIFISSICAAVMSFFALTAYAAPTPVNLGGTGTTTIPSGSLIYGNNNQSVKTLPIGAVGRILQSNGSIPQWVATSTLGFLTSAITTLNGQTGATQTFATTSSGTVFDIQSSGNTHTFTFPASPTFTNLTYTGQGTFGLASGTSISLSGNLWVTGKTTLGLASTTALTVSGISSLASTSIIGTLSVTGSTTISSLGTGFVKSTSGGSLFVDNSSYITLTSLSGTSPISYNNGTGAFSCPTCVTNVTASGNIASSGGTTPNITFTGVLPLANGGIATTTLGNLTVGSNLSITGGQQVLIGTSTQISLGTNVVTSVVNDTNVTGSISSNALTLGWTGVLSVARGGTATNTLGSLTVGSNLSITGGQSVLIGTSTQISLGSNVVTTLATGTSGSIFNGSISSNTLTLNLPFASGSNTGQLQAADWTTFNNKLSSIGSGSLGYVARWNGANTLAQGALIDNGTVAGINATSSSISFNVQGSGILDPFNIASSSTTSYLRVTAGGNVGINTTTPSQTLFVYGNLQAATGSTSTLLANTATQTVTVQNLTVNGLTNFVNASGTSITLTGNLFLPSQSSNTFFAAPTSTGGVPTFRTIKSSDIPTSLGVLGTLMPNLSIINASSTNITGTSTTDIYTVPTGRKAILSNYFFGANATGMSEALLIKVGGVYTQVQATTSVQRFSSGLDTFTNLARSGPIGLNAGESFAVNTVGGANKVSAFLNILEFDDTSNLVFIKSTNFSTAAETIVYTTPSTGGSLPLNAVGSLLNFNINNSTSNKIGNAFIFTTNALVLRFYVQPAGTGSSTPTYYIGSNFNSTGGQGSLELPALGPNEKLIASSTTATAPNFLSAIYMNIPNSPN